MTRSEPSERKSHKHRKSQLNGHSGSSDLSEAETASQSSSKRDSSKKRKGTDDDARVNGHPAKKTRRPSLTQPARDPRDTFTTKPAKKKSKAKTEGALTRSPSPAAIRLEKLQGAVRTILECVGEDPDRPGVLDTPRRYAKAMLFLTRGYQENVKDIVNNAIFQEGHNEMVIVKDIEIFSMCEHHLVPFTGKVR
ncbi:GTP cyclohydrolase 1 [Colletotrichum higginsianum]|nr:GTP cyclohydrolase 1 [Colletotrichum higginsianum]